MSQMISSGSAAATCSTKSHVFSGKFSSRRSRMIFAFSTTRPFDAGDFFGGEALRHDRTEPEVFRVVHADHRAEELVHLLGQVTDVRTLSRAEELRVAADVPDVVMTCQRVVAGSLRKRGCFDQPFREEAQPRCVAQLREGCFSDLAWARPELHVGEVDVVQLDVVGRDAGTVRRHVVHCRYLRRSRAEFTFFVDAEPYSRAAD